MGSGAGGGARHSSIRCAPSPTSTRSVRAQPTQWQHDMDAYATRWRPSAGTPSSSTATTCRRCWTRSTQARRTKGRPTMILARTLKGQGHLVHRGQAGLARQAAEEGRGARQGPRRTGGAVRPGGRAGAAAGRAREPSAAGAAAGAARCAVRTHWARAWPRARRTAPRSPASAPPTSASWRSTPTSRTRPSATSSSSSSPSASIRASSPSR